MCKFFSCIVNRQGEVVWDPETDDHTALVEKSGWNDKNLDKNKLEFARVEINPPVVDGLPDYFNQDLYKWNLVIDEEIKPSWWHAKHEVKCREALTECIKLTVHISETIKEIESGRHFVKDCTIEYVTGGTIKYVTGGTIESVRGGKIEYVTGGTIKYVNGGTIKSVMGGMIEYVNGGTIKDVIGGTIKYVTGGTIESVRGGTIESVSGGTIESVRGGTIKYVNGGTIESVRGGTIEEVNGGTITTYISLKSKLSGDTFIIIDKSGDNIVIKTGDKKTKLKIIKTTEV